MPSPQPHNYDKVAIACRPDHPSLQPSQDLERQSILRSKAARAIRGGTALPDEPYEAEATGYRRLFNISANNHHSLVEHLNSHLPKDLTALTTAELGMIMMPLDSLNDGLLPLCFRKNEGMVNYYMRDILALGMTEPLIADSIEQILDGVQRLHAIRRLDKIDFLRLFPDGKVPVLFMTKPSGLKKRDRIYRTNNPVRWFSALDVQMRFQTIKNDLISFEADYPHDLVIRTARNKTKAIYGILSDKMLNDCLNADNTRLRRQIR